jgi:predicted DCC family thiol-disulfide oxidoreductase YuxK
LYRLIRIDFLPLITLEAVTKTLILFDGECLLCNRWVRFIRRVQTWDAFEFAHLKSEFARPLILKHGLEGVDSIIVIHEQRALVKSAAVLKILPHLRWTYRWLCIFQVVPRVIRDWMYDIVARNRTNWFGRSQEITCDFLADGGDADKDIPREVRGTNQ